MRGNLSRAALSWMSQAGCEAGQSLNRLCLNSHPATSRCARLSRFNASPEHMGEPMRRRSSTVGEPVKTRRRKAITLKRRIAPKTVRRRSSSAASRHEQVARLTRELRRGVGAADRYVGGTEGHRRSPFDLQTVSIPWWSRWGGCAMLSVRSSCGHMTVPIASLPAGYRRSISKTRNL